MNHQEIQGSKMVVNCSSRKGLKQLQAHQWGVGAVWGVGRFQRRQPTCGKAPLCCQHGGCMTWVDHAICFPCFFGTLMVQAFHGILKRKRIVCFLETVPRGVENSGRSWYEVKMEARLKELQHFSWEAWVSFCVFIAPLSIFRLSQYLSIKDNWELKKTEFDVPMGYMLIVQFSMFDYQKHLKNHRVLITSHLIHIFSYEKNMVFPRVLDQKSAAQATMPTLEWPASSTAPPWVPPGPRRVCGTRSSSRCHFFWGSKYSRS